MTTTITAESLIKDYNGQVSKGIEMAESFRLLYPERLSKPYLQKTHTSAELKQYAILLEAWEKDNAAYVEKRKEVQAQHRLVNEQIELFIKNQANFASIPTDKQDKVWSKAWEDGHSAGYHEVYLELCELVDLFN